jgi:selenocysteine-specific elongation factor
LADAAQQVLAGFHAAQPLRAGMPKEELRERLGVPPALWSAVITLLANQGSLVDYGATVHLPSFEASPGVAGQARIEQIVQGLEAGGLAPPAIASITTPADAPLLAYMLERGLVVRLDESLVYPQHTYRTLVRHTIGALESGPVTVAALRDSLHISRRYALALLEHLDVQRVTRRAGDARTLLHRPSWMTEL